MKRRTFVSTVLMGIVIAAGGTAVAAVASRSDGGSSGAGSTLPKATAKVTRGDLVDTETVDGTLGYGDRETLFNGGSGTVTWTRDVGATVTRGKALYALNGAPVALMYGKVPLYRPLKTGVDGDDVEQLERNLDALGYGDDLTVDEDFTDVTAAAVLEWQHDRGLPETGVIDSSQVIFAPGPVRVTEVKMARGSRARAGAAALTVTGTKRQVHVDLPTADQHLARKGAAVTVELPSGDTVPGKISEVGTVAATPKQSAEGQGSESTESTIDVDIVLNDPKKAGRLDEAPVSVELQSERHENVLSVPVEALLALREGGYGVQIVEGASVRIVAVETGLYAEGRVEVSGPGLAQGTVVGVPSK